jgi:hypothetical protein
VEWNAGASNRPNSVKWNAGASNRPNYEAFSARVTIKEKCIMKSANMYGSHGCSDV